MPKYSPAVMIYASGLIKAATLIVAVVMVYLLGSGLVEYLTTAPTQNWGPQWRSLAQQSLSLLLAAAAAYVVALGLWPNRHRQIQKTIILTILLLLWFVVGEVPIGAVALFTKLLTQLFTQGWSGGAQLGINIACTAVLATLGGYLLGLATTGFLKSRRARLGLGVVGLSLGAVFVNMAPLGNRTTIQHLAGSHLNQWPSLGRVTVSWLAAGIFVLALAGVAWLGARLWRVYTYVPRHGVPKPNSGPGKSSGLLDEAKEQADIRTTWSKILLEQDRLDSFVLASLTGGAAVVAIWYRGHSRAQSRTFWSAAILGLVSAAYWWLLFTGHWIWGTSLFLAPIVISGALILMRVLRNRQINGRPARALVNASVGPMEASIEAQPRQSACQRH